MPPCTSPIYTRAGREHWDDEETVRPVLKLVARGEAAGPEADAAMKQFNNRLVEATTQADKDLHAAAEAGNLELVRELLTKVRHRPCSPPAPPSTPPTPP